MSAGQLSLDAFSYALGWTLVHFLWQGLLVAALLACLLSLLHRRSAQFRYAVCCVAMALMMAAPVLTFMRLSQRGIPTEPIMAHPTPDRLFNGVDGNTLHDSVLHRIVAVIDRSMPLVLALWLAGVAALLARLSVGLAVASRMKRIGVLPASAELERSFRQLIQRLSITRPIRLAYSAMVQAPAVVGWLRPMILLPVGFLTGLSAEQIEALLVHELAHICRHDYLVSVLQAITEAVFFYHPAVWWVSKQIRVEREHCCDDLAVAIAGNPILYARALSLLEERRSNTPLIALAANGGVLTMRIQRILGLAKGPVFPQPAAALLLATLIAGVSFTAIGRAQPPLAPQASTVTSDDESRLQGPYKLWLDQDARWIIRPEERARFLELTGDPERDKFIEQFWLRRDPVGAAPGTYRAEHYRRIAYANMHFSVKTPGWETARGRAYILYGPPFSIESHPSGDAVNATPFEIWTYKGASGGPNTEMRFVDSCACGEFELTGDPNRELDEKVQY